MTRLFQALPGPDGRRHAVVLSGGGAEGAYEIGVLASLAGGSSPATGGRPLRSNVFCGTSIGAFHGAFLASYHVDGDLLPAIRRLARIWRIYIARSRARPSSGIFRIRGIPSAEAWRQLAARDPVRLLAAVFGVAFFWSTLLGRQSRHFLGGGHLLHRILRTIRLDAFIDARPFYRLVRETIDLELLARQNAFLAMSLTHLARGTPRILFKEEISDIFGLGAFEASVAIPGLLPPRWLAGEPYMDGGLSMTTPFLPALVAGADVLHVVRSWPPLDRLPPARSYTFETIYRLLRILMYNNIFDNLHSLRGVSEAVQNFVQVERQWTLQRDAEPASPAGDRWHGAMESWAGFDGRGIDIHIYNLCAGRSSAAAFLDFGLAHIDRLMARGFADASRHDCAREGCLLAATSPGRSPETV